MKLAGCYFCYSAIFRQHCAEFFKQALAILAILLFSGFANFEAKYCPLSGHSR
jgi:hypothetical protein